MSLLTLVGALELLARELDHELCQVVDSSADVRLAWFFTDPNRINGGRTLSLG